MGFYKNTVSHKEGDLLRMEERGLVYIWYKEHWYPLPYIYQKVYSTFDSTQLPKNLPISWTLHMSLDIQRNAISIQKERDNGILQNDNH